MSPSSHSLSRCLYIFVFLVYGLQSFSQTPVEKTPAGEVALKSLDVTGSAKASTGEPADGVTILLEISDMRIRREIGHETTKTASDGSFKFNLDKYSDIPQLGMEFTTVSPRFREAVKIVIAKQDAFPVAVELELRGGTLLSGKVVDDTQQPLDGVTITFGDGHPATSDSNGAFELLGLPLSGGVTLYATKKGFSDAALDVPIDVDGKTEDVVIALSPAAQLRGKALAPNGEPLNRGDVVVYEGKLYKSMKLNEDGTFEFQDVPTNLKNLTIVLSTRDYLPVERHFTDEEMSAREVTLQTAWPLKLEGVVKDRAGKPRGGAEIVIGDNVKQRALRFYTDEAGKWSASPFPPGVQLVISTIPVSPNARKGAGELEFKSASSADTWSAEVNPWPSGAVSHIEAKLDGLNITMERTDSGPGALSGKILYRGTVTADMKEMKGTVTAESIGAKGEFTAKAYNPGDSLKGIWDLRESFGEGKWVEAPWQKTIVGAPFPGTQYLELQYGEPLSLSGVVKDPDGNPVLSGFVKVYRWNETDLLERESPIAAGGKFTLSGLPSGVLQIMILGDKHEPMARPFFLRGGLGNVELSIGERSPDPIESLGAASK